jgi:hypothetical protein
MRKIFSASVISSYRGGGDPDALKRAMNKGKVKVRPKARG